MQGIDLATFIDVDVPAALQRATKLQRSRLAAAGAAHACGAVFCAPNASANGHRQRDAGAAARCQARAGPGAFSESEAVVKVAKGALKQLETLAFGGRSGVAAWLLARCCRVCLSTTLVKDLSGREHLVDLHSNAKQCIRAPRQELRDSKQLPFRCLPVLPVLSSFCRR